MANIIKIKRRPRGNGAEVPQNLELGELAYSEADSKLYIGRTPSNGTGVEPTLIGGSGYILQAIQDGFPQLDFSTFVRTTGDQIIGGIKTFTSIPIFSGNYLDGQLLIGGNGTGLICNTLSSGDGITIANGNGTITIGIDNTVVRTTGTQTIDGSKTFSKSTTFSSGLSVSTDASFNNNVSVGGNIVSNGLNLTDIINKLIPAQPPTINNRSLTMTPSIGALTDRKLCFFGADSVALNTNSVGGNIVITAGTTLANVIFNSGNSGRYSTSSITGIGPGTVGIVNAIKNGVVTGTITMTTGVDSGVPNLDLIVENDRDYSVIAGPSVASGFWQSFDTRATGLSVSGWNSVLIRHTGLGFNNSSSRLDWYYDPTDTLPTVNVSSVATGVGTRQFSSSVPHWSGQFITSFSVQHLSSDTYTETFIPTITAGSVLQLMGPFTRQSLGLSGIPPRNYLVSSSQNISITGTTVTPAFSSVVAANFMQPLVVHNSRGSRSVTVTPSGPVLIKTVGGANSSFLQEDNIPATNFAGSSTFGVRISGYNNTVDTPSIPATITLWDSTATLGAGDATVVGGVLRWDRTDYSSYIPPGPNLSSRSSSDAQYFTFRFARNPLSQFAIRIVAPQGIAGLWVRLPGVTDSLLGSNNGWANASILYDETNQFTPTSTGCAKDTPLTLNNPSTNVTHTITFGPYSSSTSTANEIHVRIKLTNGQTITTLSVQGV